MEVHSIKIKLVYMKSKIFLLSIGLAGFLLARGEVNPGEKNGKKDDLAGTVIHTDSKKPLKDVCVTAFLSSKKEKLTITGEDGNFSFEELKPGKYKFIFEKNGFKKVTKEMVIITTDDAFQMNVEMIELNDFDIMPSPFHFPDYK